VRSIAMDALIAQVEATWEFYRQYIAVVDRTNAVMRKMEDLITGDPRRVRMRKLEELRRRRDDLRFAIGRENKKARCLKEKLGRVLLQKEECPTSVVKVASRQLESLGYRVKIKPMVGAENTQKTMLLSLVFCRYYIRLVMLKEITNDLYPIENCSGRYRTIRGFPMTYNGDIAALSQSSEQFPSVAVLYLAHLTCMVSYVLGVPLGFNSSSSDTNPLRMLASSDRSTVLRGARVLEESVQALLRARDCYVPTTEGGDVLPLEMMETLLKREMHSLRF
ncbi:hypothetical protein FOZ63_009605, partial [Perkinsus olseni]